MFSMRKIVKTFLPVLGVLLFLPVQIMAKAEILSSGENRVALLELYSSEGCSSCPPADKWFARLKSNKELWKSFVPIGFHVDYWNYLGWVDPFSQKKFTQRQRKLAHSWGSKRVYTPGFVKNGQEWRGTKQLSFSKEKVGILKAEPLGKNRYRVTFAPSQKQKVKKLSVHVVLMGHGLVSKVRAGENSGETLHHEFTVLAKNSKNLKNKNGHFQTEILLPTYKKLNVRQMSLAFWVSPQGEEAPIQAVGGYL